MKNIVELNNCPFCGENTTVEFDYSPPTPDVYYLPNGDPGYPGDPEEFDFLSLSCSCTDLDKLNEIGDLYDKLVAALGEITEEQEEPNDFDEYYYDYPQEDWSI